MDEVPASENIADDKERRFKLPYYQQVNGRRISGFLSAEVYRSALTYKARPGDLFIVTYPKCGTTWLQNIVACIFKEGRPFSSAVEFLSPFLELTGAEAIKTMKRPGAIKTHLPFWLAPWNTEAKYIFVARNPKDCCVSFYHHTKNIPAYCFIEGEFDDYFELFIGGKTDYGDYFDTLLSWYEHRNDPNVLFITYEQLKKDTRGYILKIAEFMDPRYREMLEENQQMLRDVIYHSSFEFMTEHLNKAFAQSQTELSNVTIDAAAGNLDILAIRSVFVNNICIFSEDTSSAPFVRKGLVGEWRYYFSSTQNARMEQKFQERTAGTDIPDLWKDYM